MFIKNEKKKKEKKNIETGDLTSSSSRASFEGSPVTNSLTRISLSLSVFLSRLYFFFFFGVMYVSHLHISRCHQLKKEAWLYPSTVAGCMVAWLLWRISTTPPGSRTDQDWPAETNRSIQYPGACSVMDRWRATAAEESLYTVHTYFSFCCFFFFLLGLIFYTCIKSLHL